MSGVYWLFVCTNGIDGIGLPNYDTLWYTTI